MSGLLRVVALIGCLGSTLSAQTVYGVVRDSAGAAVESVELEVGLGGVRTRSASDGSYRLRVPVGLTSITARRLGYSPMTQNITVDSVRDRRLDFRLVPVPSSLASLTVKALREPYEARLEGFNQRSKLKVGHFVTRERIERANSSAVSDILREIPALKVGGMRNQGRMIRLRGMDCAPLVFVDGFPASAGEFDVDMIDVHSIEGIEVYVGLGSTPAEFTGPRDLARCGVIAIWSRPARSRRALPPARAVEAGRAVQEIEEPKTVTEVDTPARFAIAMAPPHYPDSLLGSRLSGRVVVEAVVDTLGRVEAGSVEVLVSSHQLFTTAVRDALASARFLPAILSGRKVRQVVQLPFAFKPEQAQP